jgi:hypothetical protein
MAQANKSEIVEKIANNISAQYGIDQPIVEDFKTLLTGVLSEYYVYTSDPTKAPKGRKSKEDKGPKKPRKTSSYNVFVKKMMQSPEVKDVPQKEKMSMIGGMWGKLTDAEKATYQAQADAENAANPALTSDSQTETTA